MYFKWHMHWYDSNRRTYHKEITNYDWKMYCRINKIHMHCRKISNSFALAAKQDIKARQILLQINCIIRQCTYIIYVYVLSQISIDEFFNKVWFEYTMSRGSTAPDHNLDTFKISDCIGYKDSHRDLSKCFRALMWFYLARFLGQNEINI
jgi:hypothetical protein